MSTITSRTSQADKQAMMNEFTINELAKELRDQHDLLEIYKVALADEGNQHLATREHVKATLKDIFTNVTAMDQKSFAALIELHNSL